MVVRRRQQRTSSGQNAQSWRQQCTIFSLSRCPLPALLKKKNYLLTDFRYCSEIYRISPGGVFRRCTNLCLSPFLPRSLSGSARKRRKLQLALAAQCLICCLVFMFCKMFLYFSVHLPLFMHFQQYYVAYLLN